ncbi:hypothetical protein KBB68_01330 [Candidatus Babeliales bacterium]|nr:hypothetical protein [Candidatus Babeliales bacterium]
MNSKFLLSIFCCSVFIQSIIFGSYQKTNDHLNSPLTENQSSPFLPEFLEKSMFDFEDEHGKIDKTPIDRFPHINRFPHNRNYTPANRSFTSRQDATSTLNLSISNPNNQNLQNSDVNDDDLFKVEN